MKPSRARADPAQTARDEAVSGVRFRAGYNGYLATIRARHAQDWLDRIVERSREKKKPNEPA